MEANKIRKVHCFFEQSGTFKNEFIKLGISAEDYDIQNNFNQTDNVVDLFSEIDREYEYLTRQDKTRQDKTRQDKTRQDKTRQDKTVFDSIDPCQDLIVAFYPCVYFCAPSQMLFALNDINYRNKSDKDTIIEILKRSDLRKEFYDRLIKFVAVCLIKKIPMIFENPWGEQTYLKANFLKTPDIIDTNRMRRGDYFVKPTAYWFWNISPTHGESYQNDKQKRIIMNTKGAAHAGLCSEDRSMISPDYARNFICDFILGKAQDGLMQSEFEF